MTTKPLNPYPFSKSEESERVYYDFDTDQQVRYRAYFSDYGYMFGTHNLACNIYSFDLVVVGSLRPPRGTHPDPRIGDTVQEIFALIFAQIQNVVVAVYDSTDQAEQARRRKFDSWFNQAAPAHIEKIDFEVAGEYYDLISSVFVHVDLPNKETVLDRYVLILEGGNIPLD